LRNLETEYMPVELISGHIGHVPVKVDRIPFRIFYPRWIIRKTCVPAVAPPGGLKRGGYLAG
jgi:hypothetical protein